MVLANMGPHGHPVLHLLATEGAREGQAVNMVALDVFPHVMFHLALLATPRAPPEHRAARRLAPLQVTVRKTLHFCRESGENQWCGKLSAVDCFNFLSLQANTIELDIPEATELSYAAVSCAPVLARTPPQSGAPAWLR